MSRTTDCYRDTKRYMLHKMGVSEIALDPDEFEAEATDYIRAMWSGINLNITDLYGAVVYMMYLDEEKKNG